MKCVSKKDESRREKALQGKFVHTTSSRPTKKMQTEMIIIVRFTLRFTKEITVAQQNSRKPLVFVL